MCEESWKIQTLFSLFYINMILVEKSDFVSDFEKKISIKRNINFKYLLISMDFC